MIETSFSVINCAIILIGWHYSGSQKGLNFSEKGFFASIRLKSAVERLKSATERPKIIFFIILSVSDKPWSEVFKHWSSSDKPLSWHQQTLLVVGQDLVAA